MTLHDPLVGLALVAAAGGDQLLLRMARSLVARQREPCHDCSTLVR